MKKPNKLLGFKMNKARTILVIVAAMMVLVYLRDDKAYKKKVSVKSSITMYEEEMRQWKAVEDKLLEFGELIEELAEQSNALGNKLDNASENHKMTKEYQKAQKSYSELGAARDSLATEFKRKTLEYEEHKTTLLDKYYKAEEEYNSLRHPILFRKYSLPSRIERSVD